jgi:hypothetical protein
LCPASAASASAAAVVLAMLCCLQHSTMCQDADVYLGCDCVALFESYVYDLRRLPVSLLICPVLLLKGLLLACILNAGSVSLKCLRSNCSWLENHVYVCGALIAQQVCSQHF